MITKESQIKVYLKLIRPKHWLKNILVFVPLLYAYNLTKPDLLLMTVQCFISFCLISSVVYIINDIVDAEKDRQHPVKKMRPVASGQIRIRNAVIIAVILCIAGFYIALLGYHTKMVFLFTAIYFLLMIAYSFFLKHYSLIDCFAIAAGFILRVYAGAAASESPVSEWLFLTIVTISLFMAFGKRRGEIMQISDTKTTRTVLASYDISFINGILFICAGLSIVFYALWAMTNTQLMIYTVPLVIFIICKYLMIIHNNQAHGDPVTTLLSDRGLITAILIFGMLSLLLLYI
ncbi:MAG: decaprenyl-phosphate phosphoribosyltransferase [Lachnospiraceae bacterium]|nr:decaprenyl-phosphate phosphoribosyltransferase [Lachnospiraceae bacterium]